MKNWVILFLQTTVHINVVLKKKNWDLTEILILFKMKNFHFVEKENFSSKFCEKFSQLQEAENRWRGWLFVKMERRLLTQNTSQIGTLNDFSFFFFYWKNCKK